MSDTFLNMLPPTGSRQVKFVGDIVRVELVPDSDIDPGETRGRLRTDIGRGVQLRKEICDAHFHQIPATGKAWRDLDMVWESDRWVIELPLAEVGFFKAKAYILDADGRQNWPTGDDAGFNVQPDWCRTANTIYCAFPRMFGANKLEAHTVDSAKEAKWKELERIGYTVIPPSGKLRDVIEELPHIFGDLGCQILHLLPVSPTPTTMAKFGRYGSPYAVQDLTAIDPALVEFDKKTTGVEQFRELVEAVHLRDGRVILDLVINHTGWGADIFEDHPEWYLKDADGTFVSPGAWGNIWEDLVELKMESTELWEYLANVFLTWCRRGVDGFRCDAGYKVPTLVWQYVTARVHTEFPETIFLLEGLGGGWDDTAIRLTEGGMQWAYSELFQNYSPSDVANYLGHSLEASRSVGLLVNYSETHDNDRLAKKGREWSLLRNRLCALTSVSGGFGFTNGVEWLAPEQVNVHSARGLAWGSSDNIVPDLKRLNDLLASHPCFFDDAIIVRVSKVEESVLAVIRYSPMFDTPLMILCNLDTEEKQVIDLDRSSVVASCAESDGKELSFSKSVETLFDQMEQGKGVDLLSGGRLSVKPASEVSSIELSPAGTMCVSLEKPPKISVGDEYRCARARAALAFQLASVAGSESRLLNVAWKELSEQVHEDLPLLLRRLCHVEPGEYAPIIEWGLLDVKRIVPVPPGHWVIIRVRHRFSWRLASSDGASVQRGVSVKTAHGWSAVVSPQTMFGDALLEVQSFGEVVEVNRGSLRFLNRDPKWMGEIVAETSMADLASKRTVLLTNGRGGMARVGVDLGSVRSKYDCLLAANLDDELPVDRHVLIKRLRLWANADGFVSKLDASNLIHFKPGPAAVWRFRVQAGNGRVVFVRLGMKMLTNQNSVQLALMREHTEFSPDSTSDSDDESFPLRITARFDLEDRNFHWETQRNESAEHHFDVNCSTLEDQIGLKFNPAEDRQLTIIADQGEYHAEPEWSEKLPHPVEANRGQTGQGDAWSPGWFDLPLAEDGDVVEIVASAEQEFDLAPGSIPESSDGSGDRFALQLHRAASQFIVRRGDFKSVIAGYPWFLDWGRDTLICARGLISGGWIDEVKQLLIVFGRFEEDGTLPNTIHGADASNRDTSDAPLWYGVVAEELAAVVGDEVFSTKVDQKRTVADVLRSIAVGYLTGTPNGICVDGESGLVWSPSHFTWMDTNYPAGTPREGYPIEIQALWIRLLQLLHQIGAEQFEIDWGKRAELAMRSLTSFYWLEEKGWFADSIIAKADQPAGDGVVDQVLRSNCLIPISFGLLDGKNARRCVEAARRYLVVPGGLRSLAPLPASPPLPIHGSTGHSLNDPDHPYWGRYEGDEDTRRKPAYHNGTVWTWTFPTFCEALVKTYGVSSDAVDASRAYLGSMGGLLNEGCFGQIPENLDGDAPHAQRGCDAQAWGVTEALRVWKKLSEIAENGTSE